MSEHTDTKHQGLGGVRINRHQTSRLRRCQNTPKKTPRFGRRYNTLTPARTPRLGLCHNTPTPARTPRLGLCHKTHRHQHQHQGLGCVTTHRHQQEHKDLGSVTTYTSKNTKAALQYYTLQSYVRTVLIFIPNRRLA